MPLKTVADIVYPYHDEPQPLVFTLGAYISVATGLALGYSFPDVENAFRHSEQPEWNETAAHARSIMFTHTGFHPDAVGRRIDLSLVHHRVFDYADEDYQDLDTPSELRPVLCVDFDSYFFVTTRVPILRGFTYLPLPDLKDCITNRTGITVDVRNTRGEVRSVSFLSLSNRTPQQPPSLRVCAAPTFFSTLAHAHYADISHTHTHRHSA